jgi:hypothetical protein
MVVNREGTRRGANHFFGFLPERFVVDWGRRSNARVRFMFRSKKHSHDHLYYLLPGMNRAARRKHRLYVGWALLLGLLCSALLGALLYYWNRLN